MRHRPITTVEKSYQLMFLTTFFNLISLVLFCYYSFKPFKSKKCKDNYYIDDNGSDFHDFDYLRQIGYVGIGFFALGTLFFFLGSFIDPGFAKKEFDIIVILIFN